MAAHTVFVLAADGSPLTPTTAARARRLLRARAAAPVWSRLGAFGIRLAGEVRAKTPACAIGHDPGERFDGFVVACGSETVSSLTLELPNARRIAAKDRDRRVRRANRRGARGRRTAPLKARCNRHRRAPPAARQALLAARMLMIRTLRACYPAVTIAIEWPLKRSETRKRPDLNDLAAALRDAGIRIRRVPEHSALIRRERYGLVKPERGSRSFGAHAADALAAVGVALDVPAVRLPVTHLAVNGRVRPARRRYVRPIGKLALRVNDPDLCGSHTPDGLRKGIVVASPYGHHPSLGILIGRLAEGLRVVDVTGDRKRYPTVAWRRNGYLAVPTVIA